MKTDHDEPTGFSRREALAALTTGAMVTGAFASGSAQAAPPPGHIAADYGKRRWTSEFLRLDPVQRFRQAMRIQRSLEDEADILHWYHFIMLAVPVGMTPRPVVRWEGIELSRHRRIGENRYRIHGHNLSFPRDLQTGEFVDEVMNPVTGKRVRVPPMALTEDPGMIRSVEGNLALDKPQLAPRPPYGVLRREGNVVKIDAIRVPPETWPVTFIETGYEAAPADLFDDPRNVWLPTDVSGAYVFPWPKWMDMGDAPGHMFATWSGYKLRSVDQLPVEFRSRADRDYPQLLNVDTKAFDRPVPGLATG